MTKWFAYFQDKGKTVHFRLITSKDLPTAEIMAEELAIRNESEFVGVIIAPLSFV